MSSAKLKKLNEEVEFAKSLLSGCEQKLPLTNNEFLRDDILKTIAWCEKKIQGGGQQMSLF